MRQRQDQQIAGFQGRDRRKTQGCVTPQVRMSRVHKLAREALGGRLYDLDMWMRKQQSQQLTANIAGCSGNCDAYHHRAST
jgi:hypothetical protein